MFSNSFSMLSKTMIIQYIIGSQGQFNLSYRNHSHFFVECYREFKIGRYILTQTIGEIELFDLTLQEWKVAKAGLEAKRKRDRKYYSNNLEPMRERDRERYAQKKTALKV